MCEIAWCAWWGGKEHEEHELKEKQTTGPWVGRSFVGGKSHQKVPEGQGTQQASCQRHVDIKKSDKEHMYYARATLFSATAAPWQQRKKFRNAR